MKRPGGAVYPVLTLCFLLAGVVAVTASPQRQLKKGTYFSAERIETELVECVNKERKKLGRNIMEKHPLLEKIALGHSKKMAKEKKLSHRFPSYQPVEQRLKVTGLFFLKSGENIAFSEAILGEHIHEKFMKSTGHRQNLLDPDFTHCGIKAVRVKNDFYITQVFAEVYKPMQAEAAEVFLEKTFDGFYQEKNNDAMVFLPQLRHYARIFSRLNARRVNLQRVVKSLPDMWGKIEVVNLVSPRVRTIKEEMESLIREKNFNAAAVGVTPVRNSSFPGGAYSVSFLLIDTGFGQLDEKQFRELLLEEINRRRKENGLPTLELEVRQSRLATLRYHLRRYHSGKSGFAEFQAALFTVGISNGRVFTYNATDPAALPPSVEEGLLHSSGGASPGKAPRQVIIFVHNPIRFHKPGKFFMVTIVY